MDWALPRWVRLGGCAWAGASEWVRLGVGAHGWMRLGGWVRLGGCARVGAPGWVRLGGSAWVNAPKPNSNVHRLHCL